MRVKQVTCADYEHCLRGSGFPFYSGSISQRGHGLGGLLRGIASTIIPLLPRIGKTIAKSAGMAALSVAGDKLSGIPLSKAIKHRGLEQSKALLENVVARTNRKYIPKKRKNKKQGPLKRNIKRRKDIFGAV